MEEPLQAYHKTLKLPCDGLESGQMYKTILDAKVKEAAMAVANTGGQLQCELNNTPAGHLVGILKTKSCAVNLQTQYGQNISFVAGERRTFVSYGISAECRVAMVDNAAAAANGIRRLMRGLGTYAGIVVFALLMNLMLEKLHFVVISFPFIIMAAFCGLWCGRKLGDLLGTALENRVMQGAEKSGVMTEVDTVWSALTQKLDLITKDYERA